ncbi:hypothetical protein LOK49_LG07G00577 [Camellia lanceoleosa]|uniref:Uncharacterized protein n=1 Tax=Camellia lanceoleosa TaxID=1840588 RepID=A0ACC0H2S9_9ERIC|nr:hypothetical protein LOK49_LG07G00577 [Camellia lanceoleosa]
MRAHGHANRGNDKYNANGIQYATKGLHQFEKASAHSNRRPSDKTKCLEMRTRGHANRGNDKQAWKCKLDSRQHERASATLT